MLNELNKRAFKPSFNQYRENLLSFFENKVDRTFKLMQLNLKGWVAETL